MKMKKYIWLWLVMVLAAVNFTACEKDSDDSGSTPITVIGIYLEDADSDVKIVRSPLSEKDKCCALKEPDWPEC